MRLRATSQPATGSLLDPTSTQDLRNAVERLRERGLTDTEAAAEVLRENFYDWLDAESDPRPAARLRLRIVKR